MEKVAIINNLYFEQKKTLSEIADLINTSVSYISRILRENENYTKEKERRRLEKLKRRRDIQKKLIYSKRTNKIDIEYAKMKVQHEEATKELSKSTIIGKEALRTWCSSAYIYNKEKKAYMFDTATLLKPADFPLYIKV